MLTDIALNVEVPARLKTVRTGVTQQVLNRIDTAGYQKTSTAAKIMSILSVLLCRQSAVYFFDEVSVNPELKQILQNFHQCGVLRFPALLRIAEVVCLTMPSQNCWLLDGKRGSFFLKIRLLKTENPRSLWHSL